MYESNVKHLIARDLHYIKNSGASAQIGSNYGFAFKNELHTAVKDSCETITRRFKTAQVEIAIGKIVGRFKDNFPYLWEELVAIGNGAGISGLDLSKHIFKAGISTYHEDNGCSDIIFPRSDVGPVLGKTHDGTTPEPGMAVIRLIRHEEKNSVLCVTRLDGISAMTGLNDKGLAIGEASLHFYTTNTTGTIRNLLLRPLLHECNDVKEAVDFLADFPPLSAGFHFALVDISGTAAIVDRSPTKQNVRWSDGEVVFCTNHTATPFMRSTEKSRGEEGDRNSDDRYENLKMMTQNASFDFSLFQLKNFLTYHDKNGSICQHGDGSYSGEQLQFYPLYTQRAFINIVAQGKLLVSNGNPCENEYFEFKLK